MGRKARYKSPPISVQISCAAAATDSVVVETDLTETATTTIQTEIAAIGKAMSTANGSVLKSAIDSLMRVAVTTCIISETELLEMYYKYAKIAETVEETEEIAAAIMPGGKYDFAADTAGRVWREALTITLSSFTDKVRQLYWIDERQLKEMYGTTDKPSIYRSLLNDLTGLLANHASDMPCMNDDPNGQQTFMQMSAAARNPNTIFETSIEIGAAKGENNQRNFTGVLFQTDRPSEGIPAIGPGLPLYVPHAVAVSAISQVRALPLDARATLDGHANKNIVGVMQSAEMSGGDFVVHGQLWGWSQPETVAAISANRKTLGMSMNANAVGEVKQLQCGTKVFYIHKLDLLGANILTAAKATYSKTSLIAAENSESSNELAIGLNDNTSKVKEANYADDPTSALTTDPAVELLDTTVTPDNSTLNTLEVNTDIDVDVDAFFDSLDSTTSEPTTPIAAMDLQEISAQIQSFTNEVAEAMSILNGSVETLMGDYQTRIAAESASIQAAKVEASAISQEQMIRTIVAELQAGMVDKSARKTMPLSAQSSQVATVTEPGLQQIQLQLAAVSASLDTMLSIPGADNRKIIELTDQKQQLLYRLQG